MINKRFLLGMIFILFLFRCFFSDSESEALANDIVRYSEQFIGVPYKAGGTTEKGMDCSGLVRTCYAKFGMSLPRSSQKMSLRGTSIPKDEIKIGDLLFFNISRLKGNINHVGIVFSIKNNDVLFIHSTTKNGVIVSSLEELYWNNSFVVAKRILEE